MSAAHLAALGAKARRDRRRAFAGLFGVVALGFVAALSLGGSVTPPRELAQILLGQGSGPAAFTVLELRLPRALVGLLAGACFGLGGAVFQSLLRNPLASPDIIGISFGASAAAVFAIVVLGLSGPALAGVAVVSGLGVAGLIYALAREGGGARLILIGIGVSSMLQSVTAYLLARAPNWSLAEALRWLTGSLNGAQLPQAAVLAAVLAVLGGAVLGAAHRLSLLQLGDDLAASLGLRPRGLRLFGLAAGVGLVACATAITGPIAFVAFLAGPIAARLTPRAPSVLAQAALVGAALVLLSDLAGQSLFAARLPVGVVTGIFGAPYLILLIIRNNRAGAGL